MIDVLLVDDDPLVRSALGLMLGGQPDVQVVGEAADGRAGVDAARRLGPDVILMDIRMPVLDGLEATRRIAADGSLADVHVLILTTYEADDYVFEALRAGASGFVLKDIEPSDLLHAIHVVAGGEGLLSPTVTRRLIAEFAHRPASRRSSKDLGVLTDREREVLALVGQGRTNDEIASALFVSPATVKTHVGRVMSKLYARDRAQLVVAAYEAGLVVPGG